MTRLRENADFDQAIHDPTELHSFDYKDFSERGKADIRIRPNDPRFADNPMRDEQQEQLLDEFAGTQLKRLRQMLTNAGVSDEQLAGGVQLTQAGKQKVAAQLGIGPREVEMYLNAITQHVRDQDERSTETLTEQYYNAVNVMDEDDEAKNPFDVAEGRYSYEPDALGSVEVRDAQTGRTSFVQGGEASELRDRLKVSRNKDAVLAPLVEDDIDSEDDYMSEIKAADAGSYNFQWKIGPQHGTGTALFSTKGKPSIQVADVRDAHGNEVPMSDNPRMQHELLRQARDFIGRE